MTFVYMGTGHHNSLVTICHQVPERMGVSRGGGKMGERDQKAHEDTSSLKEGNSSVMLPYDFAIKTKVNNKDKIVL